MDIPAIYQYGQIRKAIERARIDEAVKQKLRSIVDAEINFAVARAQPTQPPRVPKESSSSK